MFLGLLMVFLSVFNVVSKMCNFLGFGVFTALLIMYHL